MYHKRMEADLNSLRRILHVANALQIRITMFQLYSSTVGLLLPLRFQVCAHFKIADTVAQAIVGLQV